MSDAPQIRIVLADDHALVLEGLRALLSAEPDRGGNSNGWRASA